MAEQPRLADFPFRSKDKLRYGDTDRQGHINNAVYLTFLETGRTEFLHNTDIALLEPGQSFVLAHVSINYLHEILWPGEVEIGSRILQVGGSSIRMQQCIYNNGVLSASAETVVVLVDNETRRSTRFSREVREKLAAHTGDSA